MSVAAYFPTFLKLRQLSIRKVRYTPLSDLLRGRVSGRLDVRARVDATDLPAPIRAKVLRIVRRTRLWRSEKIAVAGELLAHFADGLDARRSADELTGTFGDEKAAAKLIRRAKRRGRPLAWQVFNVIRWVVCGLIALYVLAGLRMILSRPSPRTNFLAQMNGPLANSPTGDRAWPTYRKAILSLRSADGTWPEHVVPDAPDNGWPKARTWLKERQAGLALAREAAAKPTLGFVLGPDGSTSDTELYAKLTPTRAADDPAGPPLQSVLLPHLHDLRMIALTLAADARLALEEGDPARNEADIRAVLQIAAHLRGGDRILITRLVAFGVSALAFDAVERTLLTAPPDAAGLQRLAHLLARPLTSDELIDLDGERAMFHDFVQRVFSDDGSGDGHLTWRGVQYAAASFATGGGPIAHDAESAYARVAAAPVLAASRKEVLREFDAFLSDGQALMRKPMRHADWAAFDSRYVNRWKADEPRYWLLSHLAPSLSRLHRNAELFQTRQEALLLGLALEAHRLKLGRYPQSLAELSPVYLPEVPVDRFTGGPLHYSVVEGKPKIYAVGIDGDDDGGRVPLMRDGKTPNPWLATEWQWDRKPLPDGDFPLFPAFPETRLQDEETPGEN